MVGSGGKSEVTLALGTGVSDNIWAPTGVVFIAAVVKICGSKRLFSKELDHTVIPTPLNRCLSRMFSASCVFFRCLQIEITLQPEIVPISKENSASVRRIPVTMIFVPFQQGVFSSPS
ncbi:hypothetical protein AVEN_124683-1 [Araneus ventricosus]|uniref:Uncharacterized protein n=1 Tax=Araneus ventricosus TaxID=182803 RepID=A0A4Y2JKG6_ARAVE|nr:hypothetical protein AVEN_124683-1 [Araneus ventricosus]